MIRALFFLLTFCPSLFAHYQLSVCTIFRDDAPYLKEWIEFHKLQGVDHFYLYNNNSEDEFRTVLEPYIAKNEVTLTDWLFTYEDGAHADWIAIQSGAYMDCISRFGMDNDWVACIDSDEFLFCPTGQKLPLFLKDYSEFGGVGVNWLMFGTSNIEEIPPGALMIELLTKRCDFGHKKNFFFKSIVQPKYVQECNNAHFFSYKTGMFAVASDMTKLRPKSMVSRDLLVDKIRIHHYWTRNERYFREKKLISQMKRRRNQLKIETQLKLAEDSNQVPDTTMLQFVSPLRQAMAEP